MRPIDADAFKEKLLHRQHVGDGDYYNGAEAERDSIVEELDDVPTIELERRGYWIRGSDDQDAWCCSECGADVLPADWYTDPIEEGYHYCPNCGAKMEIKKRRLTI
jgi:DNA-directed RNA polymerase subunit RPC12/RpoP